MEKIFESTVCTIWLIEGIYYKVCVEENPDSCVIWTGKYLVKLVGPDDERYQAWVEQFYGVVSDTPNQEAPAWNAKNWRVFPASQFPILRENPLIASLEQMM